MEYQVIREHISSYANPIKLKTGDAITVIKRYVGPEEWDQWLFCRSFRTKRMGWVPEQIIKKELEIAYAMEDYDAKELTVTKGEIVEGIKKLNGWVWCRHTITRELGWLPKNVIEKI